jgi:signal transduction histidine kinase
MIKNRVSLKQSEVLGTNWLRKLKTDLFARTEFIVISIFFLLCFINIIIIAVSLHYLHLDIAAVVIRTLESVLATPNILIQSTAIAEDVVEEIQAVSAANTVSVVGISLIATILLGYVAARIALAPTKNGLASQKQFISNVSHELRTPLSIIRANSEILLLQKNTRPDAAELIKSNVEELDRISGIIDNLLTLSTFRHARAMNFQSVNLSEVVRNSIEKLAQLAESSKLTLDATLDENLTLWGNRNAIEQIAMNLIKNSIIFTPPGGNILVSTYASSSYVTLEVRDTGIGIEAGKIAKVFEPFYQVETSRAHNKGSGGLGLAIVSELVKFHHGKIAIRSTPKVGTMIKIDFPTDRREKRRDVDTNTPQDKNEVMLDFSNS